jgi:hypothetical protein
VNPDGTPETVADGRSAALRVNAFAYPSPTYARFVLLLAALATAGGFLGFWLHNEVHGSEYIRSVAVCKALALGAATNTVKDSSRFHDFHTCVGPVQLRKAAYGAAGAGVTLAGGLLVMAITPLIVGRRRPGKPAKAILPASAMSHIDELVRSAALRRAPRITIGGARQVDAFSYGAFGRYIVQLPPALAIRWHDRLLFDPVLLHELAHVRRGDVTLAWLSRSVSYVLAAFLAVPVVVDGAKGQWGFTLDYLWRAVVLGLAVILIAQALLRSREIEADLRAASFLGNYGLLARAVSRARKPRRLNRFGGLTANHPDPGNRLKALDDPATATDVTAVDGFVAAFLAAMAAPILVEFFSNLLATNSQNIDSAQLLAAAVTGAFLGLAVGAGLVRNALASAVHGSRRRLAALPAAVGLAVGIVIGQVVSLDQTANGTIGGVSNPVVLLVSALTGAGATAMTMGFGRLWSRSSWLFRRAAWSAALAGTWSGLLFATMVWISLQLQSHLDIANQIGGSSGLLVARGSVELFLPSWLVTWTLAGLALGSLATGFLAARRRDLPAWAVDPPHTTRPPAVTATSAWTVTVCGLVAGLAGAATILIVRFTAGPVSGEGVDSRLELYWWIATAAACGVSFALAVFSGNGGVFALPASIIAAAVSGVCVPIYVLALGSPVGLPQIASALLTPMALGSLAAVGIASLSLLAVRRSVGDIWLVAITAVSSVATCGGAVLLHFVTT